MTAARSSIGRDRMIDIFRKIVLCRHFDEKIDEIDAELRKKGENLIQHATTGQEVTPITVCSLLRKDDYMQPYHRGWATWIGRGLSVKEMMAEILGKRTGKCLGMGGVHIADYDLGILGRPGKQGAHIGIGAGAALAAKLRGSDRVNVNFHGEAASNTGAFHESMNLASVLKLPMIEVVEFNGFQISTPVSDFLPISNVADRAVAYGIPGVVVDGNDVFAVYEVAQEAIKRAREGRGPTLIEAKTYRLGEHAGPDAGAYGGYRSKEEVDEAWKRDPIPRYRNQLIEMGVLTEAEADRIDREARAEVEEAARFALESRYPTYEEYVDENMLYADLGPIPVEVKPGGPTREMTMGEAFFQAVDEEMARDETIFYLGQGIRWTARNTLVKKYNRRIINSPISEEGEVLCGTGAAAAGMRSIVDLGVSDFTVRAFDAIYDEAPKLRSMGGGGRFKVPMVLVVSASGIGIGIGSHHSQSLEYLYLRCPGLKVVYPSTPHDAKGLMKSALRDSNPVMYFMHKLMVRRKGPVPEVEYTVPIGRAEVKREGSDVTVFTYGCMVPSALSAAAELERQGISAEVFDPRTLHPLDKESLFKSVRKTGRLVTFEEDNGGVGVAVAALVAEEAFDALKAPVRNIHYPNVTIPNCYYGERLLLPKEADLIREVKELMKYRR